MKSFVFFALVLSGCCSAASNQALQRQLDVAQARQEELSAEIAQMREQATTCQKVLSSVQAFENKVGEAYQSAKPVVKDYLYQGYTWAKKQVK